MPQENLENETLLVSHDPLFNWGLRNVVQAEMETIDRITDAIYEAVADLPKRKRDVDVGRMLSVRMSLDEGLGYRGGQRLCQEQPDLTVIAIDRLANASWDETRRSRFARTEYRTGFHAGYFDELAGTATPLPKWT